MKILRLVATLSAVLMLGSLTLQPASADSVPAGIAKMPFIMEQPSPLSVDATVAAIKANVEKMGPWTVNGVKPLHQSIKKHGGPDVRPVYLLEICNPMHAGAMLQDDKDMWASVMMPCTVSVYEKSDGKAYIGFMNARMVGMMFGGKIAEVMSGPVAEAQDKFLNVGK